MNTAQVIGWWWVNFSRSPVDQFCLLVCFALGVAERNGESSERRLAVTAQRRTRGVGSGCVPGARNAVTAGSALACPVGGGEEEPIERSATGGVRAGVSVAHDTVKPGCRHPNRLRCLSVSIYGKRQYQDRIRFEGRT